MDLPAVTADPHSSRVIGGKTERSLHWPQVSFHSADQNATVLVIHDVHGILGAAGDHQHFLTLHGTEDQVIDVLVSSGRWLLGDTIIGN